MSGSPYLEHIAHLEQENRDLCDHVAALVSREGELKLKLKIARDEIGELQKECQRLGEKLEISRKENA